MNQPEGTGIEYQKYVDVDGSQYKLHVFMPSRAFKLGARVAKFLGEPAVAMAGASEDKISDALSSAVKALTSNLHEEEVWALIVEMLQCVTFESKPINVDNHFKGRLGHLLKVTAEVMKFQFNDFFSAIGQAIADVTKKASV